MLSRTGRALEWGGLPGPRLMIVRGSTSPSEPNTWSPFSVAISPTLFTTAWTAGNFDGYEAGFRSTSSVKPGSFNPPTGTSPEFGYSITGGKVWFTYGGKRFGYIPESYWRGGFRAVTETQTYGEVYNNSPGGSLIPTMNGRVSHYRTNTGSRLTRYTLSSPYRITHASGSSFTFSR